MTASSVAPDLAPGIDRVPGSSKTRDFLHPALAWDGNVHHQEFILDQEILAKAGAVPNKILVTIVGDSSALPWMPENLHADVSVGCLFVPEIDFENYTVAELLTLLSAASDKSSLNYLVFALCGEMYARRRTRVVRRETNDRLGCNPREKAIAVSRSLPDWRLVFLSTGRAGIWSGRDWDQFSSGPPWLTWRCSAAAFGSDETNNLSATLRGCWPRRTSTSDWRGDALLAEQDA